ncbi:FAD:protein FMN transferase [Roseibium sp.]|uniref:FAD:protein FMN transferase n=1 Tax=Roseibium sp. TaxID=1936156 RepID=UPI003B50505B
MTTTRRRFLTIMAGCVASATALQSARAEAVIWRGRALGAEAEIRLFGADRDQAKQAVLAARDTIRRMEDLFSLYLPGSALNRLNAGGSLKMPPEFARLIGIVDRVHRASDGLFDPTVQPMMTALARSKDRLSPSERQSLAERIGWTRVLRDGADLSFSVPGMAMTLNGIAQGFATDRVSEVLNAHGFDPHLVHVGEYRAGSKPARIGIGSTGDGVLDTVDLRRSSVATSAPHGTRFQNGSGHIVRPGPGGSEPHWRSVTVQADTAAAADGLSTALALTSTTDLAQKTIAEGLAAAVWFEDRDGRLIRV